MSDKNAAIYEDLKYDIRRLSSEMLSFKDVTLETMRNNAEEIKILDQRIRFLENALRRLALKVLTHQLGLTEEEVLKILSEKL